MPESNVRGGKVPSNCAVCGAAVVPARNGDKTAIQIVCPNGDGGTDWIEINDRRLADVLKEAEETWNQMQEDFKKSSCSN